MTKLFKRGLSALLAVAMLCTLLVMPAWAASGTASVAINADGDGFTVSAADDTGTPISDIDYDIWDEVTYEAQKGDIATNITSKGQYSDNIPVTPADYALTDDTGNCFYILIWGGSWDTAHAILPFKYDAASGKIVEYTPPTPFEPQIVVTVNNTAVSTATVKLTKDGVDTTLTYDSTSSAYKNGGTQITGEYAVSVTVEGETFDCGTVSTGDAKTVDVVKLTYN